MVWTDGQCQTAVACDAAFENVCTGWSVGAEARRDQ